MLAVRIPERDIGSSIKRALLHVKRCISRLKRRSLTKDEEDLFWNLHADLANRRYHDMSETLCHVYYDMADDDDATILRKLRYLKDMLEALNLRRKQKLARGGVSKAQ
jgi:hypothetical protein